MSVIRFSNEYSHREILFSDKGKVEPSRSGIIHSMVREVDALKKDSESEKEAVITVECENQ